MWQFATLEVYMAVAKAKKVSMADIFFVQNGIEDRFSGSRGRNSRHPQGPDPRELFRPYMSI